MLYLLLSQILALLIDLITCRRRSERQKELEILVLRHQLRIMQRLHPAAPRVSPGEKLALAVLATRLSSLARDGKTKLDEVMLLSSQRPS